MDLFKQFSSLYLEEHTLRRRTKYSIMYDYATLNATYQCKLGSFWQQILQNLNRNISYIDIIDRFKPYAYWAFLAH